MSKDQWEARYIAEEYIYGTLPNEYLKKFLEGRKPGKILFPAEGEGRNAVYAASLGWDVSAFDQSEAGQAKAKRLAVAKNVSIRYDLSTLEEWITEPETFDAVALIFVHLPAPLSVMVHQKMKEALVPGGFLLLEAFTKKQLPRTSGGPKDADLLYDATELLKDFEGMEILEFAELEVILDEGPLHQGVADVVRLIARKKQE